MGCTAGDGGVSLLSSLVDLLTLILEGKTPPAIRPLFFGTNLNEEERWDSPHSCGVYHQKIGFKMCLAICL